VAVAAGVDRGSEELKCRFGFINPGYNETDHIQKPAGMTASLGITTMPSRIK